MKRLFLIPFTLSIHDVTVVPLALEGLRHKPEGRGEAIGVYDELGAGPGALIAVSEGAEASAPFHPEQKPIDAYNAAILDTLELE